MKVSDEAVFLDHQAALARAALRGATHHAVHGITGGRGMGGIVGRAPFLGLAIAGLGGVVLGGMAAEAGRRDARPRCAANGPPPAPREPGVLAAIMPSRSTLLALLSDLAVRFFSGRG